MVLEINNEMVQQGVHFPVYTIGESIITIRANSAIPSEKEFMDKVFALFFEYASRNPVIEE